MHAPLTIRAATVEEIRPLRHAVLRAGLPFEAANFEKDDEPDTHHVGAFENGVTVGCATIVRDPWKGEPAWRLRGMAVDARLQGTGVGRQLLSSVEDIVRDAPFSPLLWCNARVPAVPFYERLGWVRTGTEFDIPTAGPHYQMFKQVHCKKYFGSFRKRLR